MNTPQDDNMQAAVRAIATEARQEMHQADRLLAELEGTLDHQDLPKLQQAHNHLQKVQRRIGLLFQHAPE